MTEEEAKTKGCCGPNPAGVYRDELNPYTRHCEASACMAWRWEPLPVRWEVTAMIATYPAPPLTNGFCGLAGKS